MKEANPFQAFLDSRQFMCVAFALLFAVNILINFGNTGFDQAFNYYLKDELGLTSSYNGIIKAGVGFVSFISNMTLCVWIINTHRSFYRLQRARLCRLFRQCSCAPEYGGEQRQSGAEKSGYGLL